MHRVYGSGVSNRPVLIPSDRARLRYELIREELAEYADAVQDGNLVKIADALADLLVVVFGTAVEHGIPAVEVFHLAMDANFTKLGEDGKPILREDGKFLKGPNFVAPEPRIQELLRSLGANV